MHQYHAMNEIKDLVDVRYHVWLKPSKPSTVESKKQLNVPAKFQSQIFNVQNNQVKQRPAQDDFKENLKELLNITEIDVAALEVATNNWDEKNILGRGGFGVVYKGEYLATKVAIKKLEHRGSRSSSVKEHLVQSLNEMRHLNSCRHDNILPIYGYAFNEDTCFVVYQLMPGDSLDDRLQKIEKYGTALTWPQRWKIAIGTAR
jgi:hypothetical protein